MERNSEVCTSFFCPGPSEYVVANSVLEDNTAGLSGGAIRAEATSLTITGSRLQRNVAHKSGGAIFFRGRFYPLRISGSVFADNIALERCGPCAAHAPPAWRNYRQTETEITAYPPVTSRSCGAVYACAASFIAVADSTLSGNLAAGGDGGGLCFKPPGSKEALLTCVTANPVTIYGGTDRSPDGAPPVPFFTSPDPAPSAAEARPISACPPSNFFPLPNPPPQATWQRLGLGSMSHRGSPPARESPLRRFKTPVSCPPCGPACPLSQYGAPSILTLSPPPVSHTQVGLCPPTRVPVRLQPQLCRPISPPDLRRHRWRRCARPRRREPALHARGGRQPQRQPDCRCAVWREPRRQLHISRPRRAVAHRGDNCSRGVRRLRPTARAFDVPPLCRRVSARAAAALALFDYADGFQGSFWVRCDAARDVLTDILLERVVRNCDLSPMRFSREDLVTALRR